MRIATFCFVLILLSITPSMSTISFSDSSSNQLPVEAEESSANSDIEGPKMDLTVRTWQTKALQGARYKLLQYEDELEKSEKARSCEQQKKSILRKLYWKKRSMKCPPSVRRDSSAECNKKNDLKRRIARGRNICKWNKKCLSWRVWPLQWKLRMANKACECTRQWNLMRQIWRAKAIKCPQSRNVWEIKHDIHDIEQKIRYLESFVHPKPSVGPRY